MRKWVAILLLLILPLQFSWAMASSYCSHHEQGAAAQHFGHHGDEHAHSNAPDKDKNQSNPSSPISADSGHACHSHGGVEVLVTTPELPSAQSTDSNRLFVLDSSPPPTGYVSLIERPNWRSLA